MISGSVIRSVLAECARVGALGAGTRTAADIRRITLLSAALRSHASVGLAYCKAVQGLSVPPLTQGDGNAVLAEVVEVLQLYPEDASIQLLGCLALGPLSSLLGWPFNVSKPAPAWMSAVPIILAHMAAYPYETKIQGTACEVLAKLSVKPDCKAAILAGGGLRLIRAARTMHAADAQVSNFAGLFLV